MSATATSEITTEQQPNVTLTNKLKKGGDISTDKEKDSHSAKVRDRVTELIEVTRITMECDLQLQGQLDGRKIPHGRGYEGFIQSDDGAENEGTSSSTSDSAEDTLENEEQQTKSFVPPKNWANAPEFVPRSFVPMSNANAAPPDGESPQRSYAQVAGVGAEAFPETNSATGSINSELCPYAMVGECRFGVKCVYLHGLKCDFCGMSCLHPYNPQQREKHSRECVDQHEKDMELSFAVARSSEKTCGICMEVVREKSPPGEQRFGILPSCVHCFCLSCIRKWRQARQFENKIIRACPECRVTSDYVCPSRYWVETKEEKEKLIRSYRDSLSKKACRYYKNGVGECPFGNKCFYAHTLPDGTRVDVGPPRRRFRRQNANGAASDTQPASIWDFLEQWELQWFEIEDLMDMMDSDDTSLWSGEDEDDFESYYSAFDHALDFGDLSFRS